jgi:hypothetical protein
MTMRITFRRFTEDNRHRWKKSYIFCALYLSPLIHGAAIAGINLPAILFKSFSELHAEVPFAVRSNQFTRVVLEIPVLEHTPLPLVSAPLHGQISMSGKYGAGMASLVDIIESDNLTKTTEFIPASKEPDDLLLISDVEPYLQLDTSDGRPTPERLVLPRMLQKNFTAISSLLDRNCTAGFTAGYSIKTNPDEIFCKAARNAGMLGECISMLEVKRAIETGWEKSEVILNGPAKWWPMSMHAFDGLYSSSSTSIISEFRTLGSPNLFGSSAKLLAAKGQVNTTPTKNFRIIRTSSFKSWCSHCKKCVTILYWRNVSLNLRSPFEYRDFFRSLFYIEASIS